MSIETTPGFFPRAALDADAETFYQENGFLVVPAAVSPEELQALKDETVAFCRGQRGEVNGTPESPAAMRALSDDEVLQRFLCIHHVHKASDLMLEYLAHPVIREVLTRVIGPNVKCMQSMLFIKSAGKPGQAWHQDEDYIPTRDRSLAGAWIAMDPATVENGCLWVIPGSHKRGVLYPQYPHKDPRYDCAPGSYDFPYDETRDAVPVEVPAGAIVFFNGYLLHRSLPNRAPEGTYRRVLVNHYMSAESLLPWFVQEGTSVAKSDSRDIVMIAGEDPYAWKGLDDHHKPHMRSAGEGGCGDGRRELQEYKESTSLAERRRR